MSSVSDVRGIGAQITSKPRRRSGRMTFCQQDPSAHAPCTNTMVAFSSAHRSLPAFAVRLYSVRIKEFLHRRSNLHDVRLQSKMPGIEHLDLRSGNVPAECFRPCGNEERIVFAPNCKQGRLRFTEIFLKCRVERDVRGIIQKQIQLNVFVSWPLHECHIQRVRFRRNAIWVRHSVRVLPACAVKR